MSAQGKQGVCCMTDFVGGDSDEILTGSNGTDWLIGGGGSDRLEGKGGDDFLVSHTANDEFFSYPYTGGMSYDVGTEHDILIGGDGLDSFAAGYGDTIDGGEGSYDTLYLNLLGASSGVTLDLQAQYYSGSITVGGGTISGIESLMWLQGSNFDDVIVSIGGGYGFSKLYGNGGNDRIAGDYYNEFMSGGAGDDVLDARWTQYGPTVHGDEGNDVIFMQQDSGRAYGDDGNDDITGSSEGAWGGAGDDVMRGQESSYGEGLLYGEAGNDRLIGSAIDSYLVGGDGSDTLYGNDGDDMLWSGGIGDRFTGNPYADDGQEFDVLFGGNGDDILSIGYGDSADGGTGSDLLALSLKGAASGVTLDGPAILSGAQNGPGGALIIGIEAFTYVWGSAYADSLKIGTQTVRATIAAGAGNDVIEWGTSSVTVSGDEGDDLLISGGAADIIDGGQGVDTVDYRKATAAVTVSLLMGAGGAGDSLANIENVTGSAFNDSLTGNFGNNRLDGGAGADRLIGGAGDDTYYVDNIGDVIVELDGEGYDSVFASASVDLSGNFVEYLYLTGSANANGIGNGLNNIILANAGNNVLIGGEGLDTLNYQTATGAVTISLAVTGPQVTGGSGTDTISGFENIHGSLYSDHLTGNDGNNVFDGYWGGDTMVGLGGDDIYIVDHVLDNVVEAAGGGNDMIYSSVSYGLEGRDVEMLIVESGMGALNATGNANANTLVGNEFANILDGKGGADLLIGGAGDDVYIVDGAGTRVIENAGEGYDIVRTSVGLDLAGQSVEEIRAVGAAAIAIRGGDTGSRIVGNGAANILTGGIGDDKLFGGDGNDRLEGGAGRDYLDGGAGIDTVSYAHATAGVVVSLAVSGTQNTRGAGVDQLLGIENVEGSAFADRLTGDAGANVINGLDGADVMIGGAGNDVYYVDNVGDKVVEKAGGGFDTVVSSIDHVLAANVEALTLSGSDDIEATGNSLDNVLTGNAGDNRLRGGAGADTMIGGAGDDIYYVDNAGDRVVEQAGEGHDLVVSSVSFNLRGTGAEDIKLLGSAALNAEGDAGANRVTGNAGHNVLRGDAGNDVLTGGAGYDNFVFDTALGKNNVDRITDFSVADDTILLNAAIFGAAGPAGYLAQGAFQTGSVATEADDRILYDAASGNIFYDADGSGAGAAVLFAQVTPGLTLSNFDFIVLG